MLENSKKFDLNFEEYSYKSDISSLIKIAEENIEILSKLYDNYKKEVLNSVVNSTPPTEKDLYENVIHVGRSQWLLLNSIFVTFFSFFEYHLLKLCRFVEDKNLGKVKVNDISGNGIIKYSSYLYLIGDIKSANRQLKNWQTLMYYQKLRNILVHNGGTILSDKTKSITSHELFDFLQKHKITITEPFGHIKIKKPGFLNSFASLTFDISDHLIKELILKYSTGK